MPLTTTHYHHHCQEARTDGSSTRIGPHFSAASQWNESRNGNCHASHSGTSQQRSETRRGGCLYEGDNKIDVGMDFRPLASGTSSSKGPIPMLFFDKCTHMQGMVSGYGLWSGVEKMRKSLFGALLRVAAVLQLGILSRLTGCDGS